MEELKKGISRRNLLKGATLSAAGVAALGMFGCSPAGGSSSSSSKSDAAAGEKKHTWEVAPEAITDIAETVETEVLVIGAGYSGTCCALNAAQNGTKVTLVEKDGVPNGHGVGGTGAIASKALDALDIHFDKSIEMERWVSTCGSRCRESLVAKWFREMKSELKKVVWPTPKQFGKNTLVALVVMAAAALVLWGFDSLAKAAVEALITLV